MFHRFGRAAHHLLLIALWAVLCLPNLGGPSLWDIDEGNNAECSREMQASGNLIIPTNNYQLREDKPVLLYWLQIASAHFLGVNEWSARLPSALAALLAVLALYELGRQTFDARTGLLAGVILASSFGLIGAAHFANPDALLLAFTTLSLALFWHDYRSGGRGWLVGVGIASGLAFLAKGPVGLVLPLAVCLGFLAWQRHLSRLWDIRVASLALAFLLVAAPWYIWVGIETKGAWLRGFFYTHNFGRAVATMENHSGSIFFYYPLVLLVGLGVWSIFLGPTIQHTWRRLFASPEDEASHERAALRFLVLWFLVYFAAFSIAQTKLPNYILPAYPAVALFTAHFLERWRRGEVSLPAWVMRTSLTCLALGGTAFSLGLVIAGGVVDLELLRGRSFPDLAVWSWSGAILVAGAALAWWMFERGLRFGVIASVGCSAVLFAAPLVGVALESMEPYKAARSLARSLPEDQTRRDVRLASYRYFQPSLVYYSQREIERFEDKEEDQAQWFLRGQLPAFLFVPEEVWANWQKKETEEEFAPIEARVLARHRDLYSGRMILLVTNE
jgi:4-amino-4-deoxy-L-arabinose transferase-like glycosyltransferase